MSSFSKAIANIRPDAGGVQCAEAEHVPSKDRHSASVGAMSTPAVIPPLSPRLSPSSDQNKNGGNKNVAHYPVPPALTGSPSAASGASAGDLAAQRFIFRMGGSPETLRQVLMNLGWEEWRSDFHDEHNWNIMWRSGHFKLSEVHSACAAQHINHFPKSGIITNKGKLLRAHRKARTVFGKIYEFMPQSFLLPTEYTKFVKVFSQQEEKKIWICKPDNSSCGRKIFLIRDLGDLIYDQQVVVQSYIERPLTVGGFKVDLRLYVLVTSFRPLRALLYRDGLARFGTQKYNANVDLSNLYAHLTNTSINKFSRTCNVEKDVIGAGCKWDFRQLREWATSSAIDWHFLWARIRHTLSLTLLLAAATVRQHPQCFELYGFDIIVDEKLKPWLLEVNCSPALGMDCETDVRVKPPLLQDVVKVLNPQPVTEEDRMRGRARAAALKGKRNGGAIGCAMQSVAVTGRKMKVTKGRSRNKTQPKTRRNEMSSQLRGKSSGTSNSGNRNGTSIRRRRRSENATPASDGNGALKPPAVPLEEKIYKLADHSRENIGNFEALLPFDEESEEICSSFALAQDDIAMQDKIKLLVASIRAKERLLVRQQREELARRRGRVASEEQVRAAANILGKSETQVKAGVM